MNRWQRIVLVSAALGIAAMSAALGQPAARQPPAAEEQAPASLDAFALADVLAKAPPEVLVVAFDESPRPLLGAVPAALYGEDDEAFVANAPRARRLVLAARDVVRADRLARRLAATGREASVLEGGLDAWDEAMRADPPAPGGGASGADWDRYRYQVALRRAFGEAAAAPAPVVTPRAPSAAPQPAAAKKREGC